MRVSALDSTQVGFGFSAQLAPLSSRDSVKRSARYLGGKASARFQRSLKRALSLCHGPAQRNRRAFKGSQIEGHVKDDVLFTNPFK